jgi:hypothetical protein
MAQSFSDDKKKQKSKARKQEGKRWKYWGNIFESRIYNTVLKLGLLTEWQRF